MANDKPVQHVRLMQGAKTVKPMHSGITKISEAKVMFYLLENVVYRGLVYKSQVEICQATGLSKSVVSRAVTSLVDSKYLSRCLNKATGKKTHLRIDSQIAEKGPMMKKVEVQVQKLNKENDVFVKSSSLNEKLKPRLAPSAMPMPTFEIDPFSQRDPMPQHEKEALIAGRKPTTSAAESTTLKIAKHVDAAAALTSEEYFKGLVLDPKYWRYEDGVPVPIHAETQDLKDKQGAKN